MTLFDTNWVLGIVGAAGFGREVMPFSIESLGLKNDKSASDHIFFVETSPTDKEINGIRCLSESEFFALECEVRLFNVAIADSRVRERIAQEWLEGGATPQSLTSPTATVLAGNEIGAGAILCGYSTVTSNAIIGEFFQANIYSYVAHDCVIGNFVTFAPNVACNGNVHIGDHAYIGTGAVIKQGSPGRPRLIGEGAIVGMGAVVTKDVEPYATVVGNPARVLS